MYGIAIVFIHVVACIALIMIVLLQTGRGAEMGAAFGGASQTLFGGGGGNTFLGKLTTGAAVVFMITCLLLSYRPGITGKRSIMHDVPAAEQTTEAPAPPAATAPEAKPVESAPATPEPFATPAPAPVTAPEAATSTAPPVAAQPQAQTQPAPEAAKPVATPAAPAAPAKPDKKAAK